MCWFILLCFVWRRIWLRYFILNCFGLCFGIIWGMFWWLIWSGGGSLIYVGSDIFGVWRVLEGWDGFWVVVIDLKNDVWWKLFGYILVEVLFCYVLVLLK